jgi:integrating conjugative element membrane protein (TIGR03747 family)
MPQAASHRPPPRPQPQPARGPVGGFLQALSSLLLTLVAGLLIAIAIQCAGIHLWWPDEGQAHVRTMLETELGYLEGARTSLIAADPMAFAERAADVAHTWLWQKTGADRLVAWIAAAPPADASVLRTSLHALADELAVTILTTQVFAVRLAVLILALPVFALFGFVGAVDGLVERDLRRWAGGRESSYLFHIAVRLLSPAILLCWLLYLTVPVALPPAVVVLPFAALFAIALRIALASFKKYV